MRTQISRSLRLAIILAMGIPLHLNQASDSYSPAKAKHSVSPKLNASIRQEYGEVRIEATINKYGFVVGTKVRSSTNPKLDQACIDAMHRWVFRPAERNGQAVETSLVQPFLVNKTLFPSPKEFVQRNRLPKAIRRINPNLPSEHLHLSGQAKFLVSLYDKGEITEIALEESRTGRPLRNRTQTMEIQTGRRRWNHGEFQSDRTL